MKKLLLYTSVFLLFTFFTQAQSVNNEKDTSCIHGQGYWKNHSDCKTNGNGNSRDDTWDLIEGLDINGNPSVGEETIFFKSNQNYCEVFDTNPGKGGKYYILAHKYITTQLNILGTPNSLDPNNIFDESAIFLSRYTPKEVDDSKDLQAESVRLSSELAGFSSTLYCNDIEPPIIGVLHEPVNIEQNSMTLNWTAASDNVGVTNYKIFQDNTLIATVGNVLTYDVTGLNPVTLYSFHITALDAEGNESANSNTVQGLTIDTDPPVIGVLSTPVNIEQTSMTLNWTAAIDNVGVTNYNIFQDNTLIATVGNVLTYDVTGLNPVTLYSFYITALDAVGNESADSNTVQGLTIDTDPPVIGVLSTPVNIEQTTLTLDWTAATDNVGVTNYNIYKDGVLEEQVGNVLTYDVTGLSQDTNYDFYITALDAAGNESTSSNVQNVTTTLPSSSQITLTTNSVSNAWTSSLQANVNTGATLRWEAKNLSGTIDLFDDTNAVPIFDFSANNGSEITITVTSTDGLVGLTRFWVTGAALTSIDVTSAVNLTNINVKSNNTLTALDLTGLSSLTTLYANTTSISALDVSGNDLLTQLEIYDASLTSSELDQIVIDLDVNGESNGILLLANQSTGDELTNASFSAYTSLDVDKSWTIDVAAPPSADITPPTIGVLNSPTNITDTSLTLDWTAATDNVGVTSYKVFQDNVLIATLGNVLTYDVINLTQGTNYDFYITALDAAGNESTSSNVQNVTTTLPSSSQITLTTNSVSNAWTSSLQANVNTGATLRWEAKNLSGTIDLFDDTNAVPIFDFSANNGSEITITVTSTDGLVGLTRFWVTGAALTSIDVTSAVNLTNINVKSNNTLTALDLTGLSSLTTLYANTTSISALDVSGNDLLTQLEIYDASLTSSELDQIVIDLDVNGESNGILLLANQSTGDELTNASFSAYTSLDVDKSWTIDVPAPASNKNVASKVSIYPNPISSEGEVSFKATSSGGAEVKLYGSTGQFIGTLFNGETTKEKDYILNYDLNKLEQGMYFAVFKIGNETIRKKILITK